MGADPNRKKAPQQRKVDKVAPPSTTNLDLSAIEKQRGMEKVGLGFGLGLALKSTEKNDMKAWKTPESARQRCKRYREKIKQDPKRKEAQRRKWAQDKRSFRRKRALQTRAAQQAGQNPTVNLSNHQVIRWTM